jgi:hypothetical protein
MRPLSWVCGLEEVGAGPALWGTSAAAWVYSPINVVKGIY